jgi:hypothetical protein
MGLLDDCKAIQATGKPAPAQLVKSISIDMAKHDKVIAQIEKSYPALKVNRAAVEKSMKAPTGEGGVVVAAATQRNPNGGFTLYYNGKLVLTGALAEFEPKAK